VQRVAWLAVAPLALVGLAAAVPLERVVVSETGVAIVVDGSLDLAAEWNDSSIVSWRNPLNGEEYDTVYLLHNSTHYLFGAILYDPDNIRDDTFALYVKWDNTIYKYEIEEGSSTIVLCNLTDTQASLLSNGTVLMTQSSPSTPWLYVELVIPKDEWNFTSTARILFEHRHTFKLDVMGRYPEGADPSDPSTWLVVEYKKVLGQYRVVLSFVDRDGSPIDYLVGRCYVVIYFLNGAPLTTLAPGDSSVEILLPPENYTVTLYVYEIPVFNVSLEVEANITASYTLRNVKRVVTPLGEVVGIVELPAEVVGIYLEPERQLGMLIANSTRPAALRLYPKIEWNYTFVVVLNAHNFTYNPYTRSLLAYTLGNLSGIMMIGAPEGYPVFYSANGTVKGYTYNRELEKLSVWVLGGTYEVFNSKEPFAVTLNNTALKRGRDYSVDPFNVARITVDAGDLGIYYKNPAEVDLEVFNDAARVIIATPYSFRGSVELRVDGEVMERAGFTSIVPLTVVELPLDLEPGSHTVEAVVRDEDSQQTIGVTSSSLQVEAPAPTPAPRPIPWENYVIITIVLVALLIAILELMHWAEGRAVVELERRKFVRKKR